MRFDVDGNLETTSRQLAIEYRAVVDWSALALIDDATAIAATAAPQLEPTSFTTVQQYDALHRIVRITHPEQSVLEPAYNEANLLERLQLTSHGDSVVVVSAVDYDAKGQRLAIEYGGGVLASYTYDERTSQLVALETTRVSGGVVLQSLGYTYDPVGNVVAIDDAVAPTTYFANGVVEANTRYEYDATYRLRRAEGRELVGLATLGRVGPAGAPISPLPNDTQALQRYIETYDLDELGRFVSVTHVAAQGGWSRDYAYAPGSDHLLSTGDGGYVHDAHGNMTAMPHLSSLVWDHRDQLHEVDLGGGGTAYYTYGADGQRVRKVIETAGNRVAERIYVGGFERYRERVGAAVALERETVHVMDGTRRIAVVETRTRTSAGAVPDPEPVLRYQLGNHLGSSTVELDRTFAVLSYEEYYPFGSTSYRSGPSAAEVSLKRYRYLGKERDDETGLAYHGARYYAAWLGRWTAADPAGLVDGIDLYIYSRNNPIVLGDPDGRTTVLIASNKTTEERSGDAAKAAENARKGLDPHTVAGLQQFRKNEDANFSNRATNLETQMKKQPNKFNDKVVATKATTGKELLDTLVAASKNGPIKNLVIWGHSGTTGIFMREDRGFFRDDLSSGTKIAADRKKMADKLGRDDSRDISQLQALIASGDIRFAEGAVVVFAGCKACGDSNYDPGSLAVKFTETTGIASIASVGGSDQSSVGGDLNREGSLVQWYRFERAATGITKKELGRAVTTIDLLQPDDPAANKTMKPLGGSTAKPKAAEPPPKLQPLVLPSGSIGTGVSGAAKGATTWSWPKWLSPPPFFFLM